MERRTPARRIALALVAGVLVLAPGARAAPAPDAGDARGGTTLADAAGWPRVIPDGDDTLVVYQPQVDAWEDGILRTRAAVAVQGAGGAPPVYGVAWIIARTHTDKARGVVALTDLEVTRVSFPTAPERTTGLLAALRDAAGDAATTMSLARLEADLAITRAGADARRQPVRDDPPRILYATAPTQLVLVDGEPALRPIEGTALQRVINTRALLVYDLGHGRYDLSLMGRWLEAAALEGPWATVTDVSPGLERLRARLAAEGAVDLFDEGTADALPDVVVATRPTELLQTDGPARLEPVAGTGLLACTNTDQDLFVDTATQARYACISGRWFRAATWDGPWAFVPPDRLPPDFARIPAAGPRAGVLASIPGTPQASEALIADAIPQTATIDRQAAAAFTARYDGAPRWERIAGTDLDLAVNAAVPVLRLRGTACFAVDNGVWFTAPSPDGPWAVADVVPADLYAIPPSCPVHAVTYVRVYRATPRYVWVGYTPGYLGACVSAYGTVVYGTGYAYRPWVGSVWYGHPWSYGWGASVHWSARDGWFLSLGWGSRPLWRPWWGPSAWCWDRRAAWWGDDRCVINAVDLYHAPVPAGTARAGAGPWPGHADHGPLRFRPLPPRALGPSARSAAAAGRSRGRPTPRRGDTLPAPGTRPGSRPDDVYAGPDGKVYRPGRGGWETSTREGWRPVRLEASPVPGVRARDWRPALERAQEARRVGELRARASRPVPPPRAVAAHATRPARSGGRGGRRPR